MLRELRCKLGMHSTFMQQDKCGEALVCRYCEWNTPESCDYHMHSLFAPCSRGNYLPGYLRKATPTATMKRTTRPAHTRTDHRQGAQHNG